MKGIVLAGGTGSRLWPVTKSVSKQLLPIYDKPMIFYPLATLMLAGIKDVLIITTPHDQSAFFELLGDGSDFGIKLTYEIQEKPQGLAQAFLIAKGFLANSSCLMILGDNIFHGVGLGKNLRSELPESGAHIFTYEVSNPSDYGIVELDKFGIPVHIEEKPLSPKSKLAVTGLYFFDNRVTDVASKVTPSARGELEITSVIEFYLQRKELTFTHLSRGAVWLDTGNPRTLNDASNYIRVIEERSGLRIACLEEIAVNSGWISKNEMLEKSRFKSSQYYEYLLTI